MGFSTKEYIKLAVVNVMMILRKIDKEEE